MPSHYYYNVLKILDLRCQRQTHEKELMCAYMCLCMLCVCVVCVRVCVCVCVSVEMNSICGEPIYMQEQSCGILNTL